MQDRADVWVDKCPSRDNPQLERMSAAEVLTWQPLSKASIMDMIPIAGHPVVIHWPLPWGQSGRLSHSLASTLPKEKGVRMERILHGKLLIHVLCVPDHTNNNFFNPQSNPRRQALLLLHSTERKLRLRLDEHLLRVCTAGMWNLDLSGSKRLFLPANPTRL